MADNNCLTGTTYDSISKQMAKLKDAIEQLNELEISAIMLIVMGCVM